MLSAAKTARAAGAELVVYPESSAFGWLNPKVFIDAQPIPGPISDKFSSIAKRTNIWIATGIAEKGPKAEDNFHHVYNSSILLNPKGKIVLHHRKNNVLKNVFNSDECPSSIGINGCNYMAGSEITVAETPFGKTTLLVCADAYDTTTLDKVKSLSPEVVIIPWGVAASKHEECGKEYFNATRYAAKAAKYLGTAHVIGANAIGMRPYGRFLPSVYCGNSGYATPSGQIGGIANTTDSIAYFDIPRN